MTKVAKLQGPIKPGQVYCGRSGYGQSGRWGNPEPLTNEEDRLNNIGRFHHRLFFGDLQPRLRHLIELKDKELFCFCAPNACHCDVYADICNQFTL